MPSKSGVTAYLGKEDKELFEIAEKKYKMGKSELAKEIIHQWLFNNKLKLVEK